MPKIKTRKTAAKRFKLTGTGKIMHGHTKMNHLMMKKNAAGRRRLGLESVVSAGDVKKIQKMIPGIK